MQTRKILFVAAIGISLLSQKFPDVSIRSLSVGPEPPLRHVECKNPVAGYLSVGNRSELTPSEIGQYILSATDGGKLVEVFPKSKSGTFVYETCRQDATIYPQ
jgi:hypothetical protein